MLQELNRDEEADVATTEAVRRDASPGVFTVRQVRCPLLRLKRRLVAQPVQVQGQG